MSEGDIVDDATRLQIVGTGFVFVGSWLLIFVAAFSVAHYGYGIPIHVRYSGLPASEGSIGFGLAAFVAGGASAVLAGRAMRRRANAMIEQ